jgi:hypothetical protein
MDFSNLSSSITRQRAWLYLPVLGQVVSLVEYSGDTIPIITHHMKLSPNSRLAHATPKLRLRPEENSNYPCKELVV